MSRDGLIDKVDNAKLQQLQAEIEALKLKLEKGKKPSTTSSNSSRAPSRDQKVNRPQELMRHRHGLPVGHVKYERKLVAKPDHIMEVSTQVCEYYQAGLRNESRQLVDVNQIV